MRRLFRILSGHSTTIALEDHFAVVTTLASLKILGSNTFYNNFKNPYMARYGRIQVTSSIVSGLNVMRSHRYMYSTRILP